MPEADLIERENLQNLPRASRALTWDPSCFRLIDSKSEKNFCHLNALKNTQNDYIYLFILKQHLFKLLVREQSPQMIWVVALSVLDIGETLSLQKPSHGFVTYLLTWYSV